MKTQKALTSLRSFLGTSRLIPWMLLIMVAAVFAGALYPDLVVRRHVYALGDVGFHDVKAPIDFLIEDHDATMARRREAREAERTVYDLDPGLAGRITRQVETAFGSLAAALVAEKQTVVPPAPEALSTESPPQPAQSVPEPIPVARMKGNFEEKLGLEVEDEAYRQLIRKAFDPQIAALIVRISGELLENGIVVNKELLLREGDRGIVLRSIGSRSESREKNLKRFYGLEQARTMVRVVGQPLLKDHNHADRELVVDFSRRLIQPNITLNRSETEERRLQAAAAIKPVLYKIKAGEMLLREGERVREEHLRRLRTLAKQEQRGHEIVRAAGALLLLVCLLVASYFVHLRPRPAGTASPNKDLLFLAGTLITFLVLARLAVSLSGTLTDGGQLEMVPEALLYGVPVASAAMTICLFLGLRSALAVIPVVVVAVTAIFHNRFDLMIYFLINGTLAAYWMRDCRERRVFVKTGAQIGLLNLLLVTGIAAYGGEVSGPGLLWGWAFGFMGGIGAGLVTAGLAPLLEMAFDYTTDIKLLELANLDRPILRRLMMEAPGTYHHSVIVGSMVEAAAAEIGANPLLAKVCGYYHDIGKVNKPLYFIENQRSGRNRHDKLAPSMSRTILVSHVKEGVNMARENKLGSEIIDTIQQSHGTSLITFFYEKARKLRGDENVNPDDYRYPGPRPQTREAGLVMLADVVEAASRTLDNPTPSRIQGHTQKLINQVFSDGQLGECELTLKDLHSIAKSFNKILYGIHHHRIDYPEKPAAGNGKNKNGSADRKPSEQRRTASREDSADSRNHLRRLGLS